MLKWVAGFIGLFKVSSTPEWPGICSYISLILFYIMVCNLFVYFLIFIFSLTCALHIDGKM